MQFVFWPLAAIVVMLVGWIALVAFRGASMPLPPSSRPNPTNSREEALSRLARLQALDDRSVAEACRTRLLEPDAPGDVTVVIWHGFTNAPSQFAEVAEGFRSNGYRVLLARMPRHGLADVLNRDLLHLTDAELVEHADACIDIAAGFGSRVWVVGLSAGGVMAAWAAATRSEVSRTVLSAPFVAPKAIPMPAVRLLVRFRPLVPRIYLWWDPRKKADLGESPYVYPGFPLPGMVPFLHLAQALYDGRMRPNHRLRRAVLVSNPGDFAIRRDVARRFAERVFASASDTFAEATIDGALGWWHDFVDPWGPHVGSAEQATAVFSAALGIGDDPSALGTLIEPYPIPDAKDPGGRAHDA
jgi:carboxylesterase